MSAGRTHLGKELYFNGTKVAANASIDSLKPRFAIDGHLTNLFEREAEEPAQETDQTSFQKATPPQPGKQEETKQGADMGYHTHYVVDGGKARIRLMALVTASEVMDNQPMLDLVFRVRFRWKLWPRHVAGDRNCRTEENRVAIEREHIHAYIPSPDLDHWTELFSSDRFHYVPERDAYRCPAGK